jgi:hypothetical protein
MGAFMQPYRTSVVTERRAAERQRVAYRLDVTTGNGHPGCLLDVSTSGLRVRFKHALDVGAVQGLRIDFPRWLELGSGIEVDGRFVWVRATPNGGTEAGFAFAELSRKVEGVLAVLVQRLADAETEDTAEAA